MIANQSNLSWNERASFCEEFTDFFDNTKKGVGCIYWLPEICFAVNILLLGMVLFFEIIKLNQKYKIFGVEVK